jgi:hypothetical protein
VFSRSRPSLRATLLLALVAVLAGTLLAPAAQASTATTRSSSAEEVPGPVVLLGTGGLRWSDTGPATPALRGLLRDGAVAVASARSVRPSTCPVDGWLAVSAGARAADEPGACRAPDADTAAPGAPASAARWDVYRRLAAASPGDATVGLLGATLGAANVPSAAVGPGAVLALANPDGQVRAAWPGLPAGPDGAVDPAQSPATLAEQVRAALGTGARLVAVDVGSVRSDGPPSHDAQVRAVDARLGAVLDALPPNATVLVASLADTGGQARLQLAGARGPAPGGRAFDGLLRSASTRQDGLVQVTDVQPTLLAALGVAQPAGAVGSPLVPVAFPTGTAATTGADAGPNEVTARLQRLEDLARPAETIDPIVAPFFAVALGVELLLLVSGVALTVRRRRRNRPSWVRAARGTAAAAVVGALLPAATFPANLWPWWRAGAPAAALAVAVAVVALVLAAIALAGPWRRALLGPAGAAGALTALVLTVDVATGSHLSLTALIGGQPLVGGRFYGFSNPGFALFATGALLLAMTVADPFVRAGRPRSALAAVAAIGVVATVVDGLPGLGSDFGGPPALVTAFAYLALRVGGVRLTWRRVLAVAAGTVAVLAVLAVGDWLRPASDRTHLGRFVQTVLAGGGWDVVTRKIEQNIGIVTSSPVQLVLPLIAVALGVVLARPRRWRLEPLAVAYERAPSLRPGLAALAVLLVAGFLVNDSGAAIPPVAAMLALPAVLASALRAVSAPDPAAGRRDPVLSASGRPATPTAPPPRSRPPAAPVPRSGADRG